MKYFLKRRRSSSSKSIYFDFPCFFSHLRIIDLEYSLSDQSEIWKEEWKITGSGTSVLYSIFLLDTLDSVFDTLVFLRDAERAKFGLDLETFILEESRVFVKGN